MPIHLKLLLASVFWGMTPTFGRVLAPFEAPLVVVFGRFFVAGLFLLWFVRSADRFVAIPRRLWGTFLVLGACGIFLHNGLMFKGLEYTTATTASIILALIAIQVVVLDWVFYRRAPDTLGLAGVGVAFVGTVFVITEGRLDQVAELGLGAGEVLVFFSALTWAVYSVVGRGVLERYSPLIVTTYATLIGLVFMLPFLFERPAVTLAVYSDPTALGAIAILGSFGTALGFLWYYQAVIEMGTVNAAIYINLVPVFGVLSAMLFLGESASPAVLFGGVLVMAGVLLVNRPRAASAEAG
ncbi:MAG: DMT family transporter [Gammaproteobacteria bacterium]